LEALLDMKVTGCDCQKVIHLTFISIITAQLIMKRLFDCYENSAVYFALEAFVF